MVDRRSDSAIFSKMQNAPSLVTSEIRWKFIHVLISAVGSKMQKASSLLTFEIRWNSTHVLISRAAWFCIYR